MNDFYHRRLNVLSAPPSSKPAWIYPTPTPLLLNGQTNLDSRNCINCAVGWAAVTDKLTLILLTPEPRSLSADAVKRLEAIEAAGDLGVGFTLATHDMEIRGAGELLGDDQSGQIESIGFSLYMDMLNQAVSALQSGQIPDLDSPSGAREPRSKFACAHANT